ncbi:hypothetical protein C2E23DRAFT_883985 [Lenzites betulinus]|nr:hypothetical protein C2E23DRAFT_883985 [Lenzites betulinus]
MPTSPRKTRSASDGVSASTASQSSKKLQAPAEVVAKKQGKKQKTADKRKQAIEAVSAAEKRMSEKRASVQAAREAEQRGDAPSDSESQPLRIDSLGRMFACEDFNDPKAVARWRDITEANSPGQLEALGLKKWADSIDASSDASTREMSEAPTEPAPHRLRRPRYPLAKKRREHSPTSTLSARYESPSPVTGLDTPAVPQNKSADADSAEDPMEVDDHAALLAAWGQSDIPPTTPHDTITARRTQPVSQPPVATQETSGTGGKPKPKPKPRPRAKTSKSRDTDAPAQQDNAEPAPVLSKETMRKQGAITGPAFVSEDEGVERDAAQSSPIKAPGTRLTTDNLVDITDIDVTTPKPVKFKISIQPPPTPDVIDLSSSPLKKKSKTGAKRSKGKVPVEPNASKSKEPAPPKMTKKEEKAAKAKETKEARQMERAKAREAKERANAEAREAKAKAKAEAKQAKEDEKAKAREVKAAAKGKGKATQVKGRAVPAKGRAAQAETKAPSKGKGNAQTNLEAVTATAKATDVDEETEDEDEDQNENENENENEDEGEEEKDEPEDQGIDADVESESESEDADGDNVEDDSGVDNEDNNKYLGVEGIERGRSSSRASSVGSTRRGSEADQSDDEQGSLKVPCRKKPSSSASNTSTSSRKVKFKIEHLPGGLPAQERWTQRFAPTLVRYQGTREAPWDWDDTTSVDVVQRIWNATMSDICPHDVVSGDVVHSLATARLYDWRKNIGHAAGRIVEAFFSTSPKYQNLDNRASLSSAMLEGHCFAFLNTLQRDGKGVFRSRFVLPVIATHLEHIEGAIVVPGLYKRSGEEDWPCGAIGLATAAVERMFEMWSKKQITLDDKGLPVRLKILNPATGNTSRYPTDFREEMWSGLTNEYTLSALGLTLERRASLLKEARQHSGQRVVDKHTSGKASTRAALVDIPE